ncbi:glycosyltransferase [Aquirufa rosea]|uniref:Glycosyltransferase family 2 protein n=1 Tax=Aquirufa rosea TaxID=2509241 RepID=A0A4Q1BYT9_9BACT|nr:glycosyltransferase [Aquirufa rosea]RXK48277.1 glycosyltransferase family 2 protein [Aquirufa rosea]
MNDNCILTIGVPTYNRAFYLESFFKLLFDVLKFTVKVKVLISDNNSPDNTEEICKKWVPIFQNNNIQIEYIKREEHVSGVENILSLFKKVDTPYFMFLGDDDALNKDGFLSVIEALDHSPSAVIQNIFSGKIISDKFGFVNSKDSFKLFYEYGNAFVSIIATDCLSDIFSNKTMSNELSNMIWPQTVIGYLTILELESTKRPYIINQTIGDTFVAEGTKLTNSEYWVKSLQDLLVAALLIKKYSNKDYAIKNFISLKNHGFISHIKAIISYSILQNIEPPITALLELLKKNFGFRGILLKLFLQIFLFRKTTLFFSAKTLLMIKLRMNWKSTEKYIHNKQIEYLNKINNVNYTKYRYQNWF